MDNLAVIRTFFDALNNSDIETVVECFDTSANWQIMGRTPVSGRKPKSGIAMHLQNWFAMFPKGLSYMVETTISEGKKMSAQAHCVGMHESGKLYSNEYHFAFTFTSEGKIQEIREYFDTQRIVEVIPENTAGTIKKDFKDFLPKS